MLQSKSSAASLTSHTTVAVVVDTMVTYKRKYYDFRKKIVWDCRLVGIVKGFGIHDQRIFVKFAEVWRNRLLIVFTPAYFAIEIPKEGHIFVTGSGKGPTIKAMVEKDMVLEEDLSFHEAFSLGCEGLEGAHKEDIHTDGFRRGYLNYLKRKCIHCGWPEHGRE